MKKFLVFALLSLCGAVNAQMPGVGSPMVPNAGPVAACTASGCTFLAQGPYFFPGADGTVQFATGATNSAAEYLEAIGGISGAGGSLIAVGANSNVAINFTAKGNANVNFANSGSGQLASGVDPGAAVSTGGQVQLTPSTSSGPAKIGNVTYGVNLDCGTNEVCRSGNSPIQTAGGVYAFNVNGDFQIDQLNEGSSGTFGSGRATDGWFGVDTFGSTLTYQRSTTVPTSVGPYYTAGKIVNGGAATVVATTQVVLTTSVLAYDIAPALWGTASAKPLTLDGCYMSDTAGLTYPATIAVSLNNNAGGSNYQSFIHNVVLPAASTWTCVSIPIAGPTNNTGIGNATAINRFALTVALGCGSNFQTATADAWVGPSTLFLCTSAQTQIVATAGADLYVTGFHLRYGGSQNYLVSPFQQLPYETELLRARKRYWKTFAQGTKPAQNIGSGTGEFQFPATIATTGTQRAPTIFFPLPLQGSGSVPSVTFFNPSAVNGNCRDETAAGDGGAPSVSGNIVGTTGITINCTGNASTAVNNLMGVHITVDTGQ